jgi:hypothetical protein
LAVSSSARIAASFPGDRYRRLPPNGATIITARDPLAGQTCRLM